MDIIEKCARAMSKSVTLEDIRSHGYSENDVVAYAELVDFLTPRMAKACLAGLTEELDEEAFQSAIQGMQNAADNNGVVYSLREGIKAYLNHLKG